MNFIRELEVLETITEEQKVFVSTGIEGQPDIQLIGTRISCKVWNEDKSLIRVMAICIPLEHKIEDKDVQELIEEVYKVCELGLLRAIKKTS